MTWKMITLALAGAMTAVAFVPRAAEALPSNEVTRYYYSDAAKTNEVGIKFVTSCYGVVNILEGSTGPYATQISEPCDSGPPSVKCYVHGIEVPCGY